MARCWEGLGNLSDGRPIWVGNFESTGFADRDVLFHAPGDHSWWLGSFSSTGSMTWRQVGDTSGFGNVADGRPFWIADFDGTGTEDVLMYAPADRNWWLGSLPAGGQLTWRQVANTAGFGNVWDGRPFWVQNFTGAGGKDLLFYSPADGNWWLGSITPGGALTWQLVGNTSGFGNLADGRPIWTGYFSNFTVPQVLFYFPGDGNWWLGSFSAGGASLTWGLAGNTSAFGNLADGRPFWIHDFDADAKDNVLFHNPADHSWWLGAFSNAGALTWNAVGNTSGFGTIWPKCRFWTGYFRGVLKPDILFYQPYDGNWWLGTLSGAQINWQLVGNTSAFGDISALPFWTGFFKGWGGIDVLFYYNGDGNWWLGSISGTSMTWTLAGNTGRSYARRVRVHFKLLATPYSVPTHFGAMKDLYAGQDILVELGSVEDLSAPDPALDDLRDLDVGDCTWWIWPFPHTTAEQDRLFTHRNGVGADEPVVYVCRTLTSSDGTTIGCATFPGGAPGCVTERAVRRWVAAHEIGHVLGLGHVNDTDRLMNPDDGWTNVPPDLVNAEGNQMRGSGYTQGC